MADAILMSGGVGGVTSDDVTARREHVLQGYTALTADSDDEVVEGTIPNRGNGMVAVDFTNAHWESKFVARMEQGYYSQIGQWKPYVSIPYAVLANIAGIDANKMLDTLTIAGVKGTIPIYGAWNTASEIINATWENPKKIYFRFKKGYYLDDGQYPPSVSATYKDIANAVGIRANKILDDENILGTQGTVPRWICTTAGVITALNGEGFVWDDSSGANRGRGIVTRIPDKHFIQDASYVFLGSPNLYPQNVRQGVNINGVVGTMPDYSTGRTVFNGATFDGLLASGVAAKSFYFNRELYSYQIASGYGYSGVYGGGMNLSLRTTSPELRGRKIGCILSQSNNLTPFRRIVVDYRTTGSISGNPTINFYAFIAPSRALVREGVEFSGARVDGFSHMSVQVMASERQGQLVIDTSNINEQAFLGFYASANASGAESFSGAIQITKIEFFN